MILIKDDSVRLKKLTPALAYIFQRLSMINQRRIPDYPIDFVITSINDGTHSPDSRHYRDEACDLRSKNFLNNDSKNHFRLLLQMELGDKFTVLLENLGLNNEHFHIQVKKGMTFP